MKVKENKCSENDPAPSHNEAFECLKTAMKWLERQNNVDPIQLTYLRRIRDMAALERMSSLKQATIVFCLKYNLLSSENDKKLKKKKHASTN